VPAVLNGETVLAVLLMALGMVLVLTVEHIANRREAAGK
jgi:hypothetical protein